MKKLRAFDEEPFVNEIRNKRCWNDESLGEIRKKIKVHLKGICDDKCYFCKSTVRGRDVNIEHIVSKAKHSIFTYKPENLILSCSDCNSLKNDSDVFARNFNASTFNSWNDYPMESGDYKIIHPYIDQYEEHLIREGILYKYKDNKGLETIKAYNLDRLILAEKNAMLDKFDGVLLQIINDTSIDKNKAKKMIEEVLNPKPKYAPFDEFINLKLTGADPFNSNLISAIKNLDEENFNSFNEVIQIYSNNSSNLLSISSNKLNDALEILKIIKEVIRYVKDRRRVRVLCSENIEEISQYFQGDIFLKSTNEQVLFAIKFLRILSTLNSINFINQGDLIIEYVNSFIRCLNDSINNIGA